MPRPPRPSLYRRTGRWLLAAGAAGLALLLVEGVLWLDYGREVARALAGRDPSELTTRAAPGPLLYRLKPNVPGLTNEHGFRDLERSVARPADTVRLAVLGDSVSMQLGVPFEELWVRRLEALLAPHFQGRQLELLNFAVTGYGVYQQAALLDQVVLAFEPDAILWQFHHNDASDPVLDGGDGGLGVYYGRPRFYLGRFVERRLSHWRQRRAARRHPGLPTELARHRFYWDRVGEALGTVRRLTIERDLPVYLFVFPRWPDGDDWSFYDPAALAAHERLVERFGELGFATLDLLPLLAATDPEPLRAAPDDPWHPSPAGHAWLAARLAEWLGPLLEHDLPSRAAQPASASPGLAR